MAQRQFTLTGTARDFSGAPIAASISLSHNVFWLIFTGTEVWAIGDIVQRYDLSGTHIADIALPGSGGQTAGMVSSDEVWAPDPDSSTIYRVNIRDLTVLSPDYHDPFAVSHAWQPRNVAFDLPVP